MLDAGDARPAEGVGDPDADLVVTGVGGLVAEQDQVVGLACGFVPPDGLHDRARRCDRAPLAAVGLEEDQLARSDRHRVAQLLGRVGRSEREHRHDAALELHDPDGLLDGAFLVRADREPEQARVDLLGVRRHGDLAADHRDALDADEDVHAGQLLTRSLSGSNSGVDPTTATVTG